MLFHEKPLIEININKKLSKVEVFVLKSVIALSKRFGVDCQVSQDFLNLMRRRATWELDTFYNEDGTVIPYTEIPEKWRCCIDLIEEKYSKKKKQKTIKYTLADRQKSMDDLNTILEFHHIVLEEN